MRILERLICLAENIGSACAFRETGQVRQFIVFDRKHIKHGCERVLSGKMGIAICSEKIPKFSKMQLSFYVKYSFFVFNALKKSSFQRFLKWVLTREKIRQDKIEKISVMIFPFQKKNGKTLAGKCNSDGEIYIYPKKLDLCRKLGLKIGKERVHSYIKNRAKAALIHELLHIKYSSNEERVRTLTKRYFGMSTCLVQDQNAQSIDKM